MSQYDFSLDDTIPKYRKKSKKGNDGSVTDVPFYIENET